MSTQSDLVKQRRRMLAMATAILIVLALVHALVARPSLVQFLVNLLGGLAATWLVTWFVFGFANRLASQLRSNESTLSARERELGALQRISGKIATTLELNSVLSTLIAEAIEVTGAQRGYVALDAESLGSPAVSSADGNGIVIELDRDDPLLARLTADGTTILSDAEAAELGIEVSQDMRSVLATPISYAAEPVGYILLEGDQPQDDLAVQVEFVETLAEQASIGYGNARRYAAQIALNEALRRRADQQQSLYEASCALRMDQPLDVILEDIAYAVQESVGFGIVLISVVEGDPPHLRRMAGVGIPLETLDTLRSRRQPLDSIRDMFQDRFLLSQSYYIPHQEQAVREGVDLLTLLPAKEEDRTDGMWHAEDILFTPLRSSEGRLLGVISVDDPEGDRVPGQTDVEVLETFAAQAALAIENAQLYGTLQRRVVELDALNEIVQTLSSTLVEQDLLDLLHRHTTEIVAGERFAIALYDYDEDRVAYPVMSVDGMAVDASAFPEDDDRVRRIVVMRTPLLLSLDSESQEDAAASVDKGDWIGVPMAAADRVIGAIISQAAPGETPYNSDHVNLLSTVAAQAATALQNARLYDQIRRFSAELEVRVKERTEALAEMNAELTSEKERAEALYRITSELGASLDLDRILSRALSLVCQIVGTRNGAILMVDRETQNLSFRTLTGVEDSLAASDIRLDSASGVPYWVMSAREPLVLDNAQDDARWNEAPIPLLGEVRSLLAAPLMLGDEVLGVVLLADSREGLVTSEDTRLVSAAASQVAQAISNAELYSLILQQARRLGDTLRSQQTEASEKAAILDGIADGVIVVNPRAEIILLNRAAEDILDAEGTRLIGRSIQDFATDGSLEDRAVIGLGLLREWLSNPWSVIESQVFEERYEADGHDIMVRLAAVKMSGEILGAVAVFRDITREVQADRAKTEFISTVSHELRTPMTSIKGYTDLLLMSAVGELNESQKRFLGTIKSNVDRLAELVGDLLDISRMESGRVDLELESLPVGDILSQAIASMRGQFSTQNVLLVSQIPPGLPPIRADRKRLMQVLTNLLRNACQYTLPGGQTTLTAHSEGDNVQIDVIDTGIGISEKDQKRLFERFFRAEDHPVVLETAGTGLGLAIVKTIVEMHHGNIWIESALGEGTTVSFTLPTKTDEVNSGDLVEPESAPEEQVA